MGVPNPLDEKSRHELVEEARKLGVERPERMTRVELRDEIVRRSVSEERQAEARGLFGVARSMLASVVDRGLHLPDAARVIRGESSFEVPLSSQTPVATVTLAEIYAAQGHKNRALRILDDVLREEPEHEEALRVQAELRNGTFAEAERRDTTTREELREALTREAPPVVIAEVGATTEYVPGGFVETVGEEIETGRPPIVADVSSVAEASSPADATPRVEAAPEPPKPERRQSPALVLEQSTSGLAFYWELPGSALEECSIDQNDGRAVARIVSFSPHGNVPERHEETVALAETIPVDAPDGSSAGKLKLDRYGAPAAVRAALGWESEDGFLPLTVGRALASLPTDENGDDLALRAAAQLS
jgi:hypothetical protein